jgi:transcriptional regulator with XRE-family HTH domain
MARQITGLGYDRAQVGAMLRERRLTASLTQAEVAWHSGITQAALSNYENGKRDVPLPALLAICRVLEIYPAQLIPNLAAPVNGEG